jgi:hypothetical protein
MTVGKANRTVGVNRALGRLGYDNGKWIGSRGTQDDYQRGIVGLSPERRKAALMKKKKYSSLTKTSSPRKGAFND